MPKQATLPSEPSTLRGGRSATWLLITAGAAISVTACTFGIAATAGSSGNSPGSANGSSPSASAKVPASISVNPSSVVLTQSNQQQLTAVVRYVDGSFDGNVQWASSDNSILSVNSTTGMVTAVKQGVATVTATSPIDSSKVGMATITVQPSTVTDAFVVVSPASATISVHATVQLSGYVQNSAGQISPNFSWSSSNESIAIVSGTGLVTGIAAGSATITAKSQQDPTKSGAMTVTVTQ